MLQLKPDLYVAGLPTPHPRQSSSIVGIRSVAYVVCFVKPIDVCLTSHARCSSASSVYTAMLLCPHSHLCLVTSLPVRASVAAILAVTLAGHLLFVPLAAPLQVHFQD